METVGISANRALMIGDTTHDMEMARAAGVARVALACGAHERAQLLDYAPLACLNDCAELESWLAQNA
jgi:phosphoglycolate phosphatase